MRIFVHRASECLTDHLSHGDGLICHSLLGGLADRGHRIYAYTNQSAINAPRPLLEVRSHKHRVPMNSLADWEHAWVAGRWLRKLVAESAVDVVWRMHPYGRGCPILPHTYGLPLVIGPIFYDWPKSADVPATGRPRLGVGLGPILNPIAKRGWRRTLQTAQLVLCATRQQSEGLRQRTDTRIETLPVIVEPPEDLVRHATRGWRSGASIKLAFVANLVPNKRPDVFCRAVALLRASQIEVSATIIGEGPLRPSLEAWCRDNELAATVRFFGRLPNLEVFRRLAGVDLLVSASFGEPYGRSIVEAMSVGTAALCHRSGGPADFIDDGIDGALCDELTPEAYASRIIELLRSQRLADLGRAARTKAQFWRANVVLDRLEGLLADLLQPESR